MVRRRRAPRLEVRRLGDGLALGEAVGKDLIKDGILDPLGNDDVSHVVLPWYLLGVFQMSER